MSRLSVPVFAARARELRDRYPDNDHAAGVALFELVRHMADSAQGIRDGASEDVYIKRGLAQWDRDMSRVRAQLQNVMRPALDDAAGETAAADVIAPVLEGVWPTWVTELPQYVAGVRPMDPLLPPTTRKEVRGGVAVFKTAPVVDTVVGLWNGANEARGFDATSGDDAPSRSIKAFVTEFARTFEERAPGDEPTTWDRVVEWTGGVAEEAADGGAELWDAASGGFARVVGIGVGIAVVAWAAGKWLGK